MSIFSLFGGKAKKPSYPQDKIATRDGGEVTLTFFGHASLAIEVDGRHIYIDPVDSFADYAHLPKADVVIVTHSHYDHLDRTAIDKITTRQSAIVCDKTSAEAFDFDCFTMTPGTTAEPIEGLHIEATAAYNTSEGHLDFHPKAREDCGYILTIGGTRFYIAGDTENNEDVKAVKDIDVAFLPVNQPYTMTVDQAVDAVKAIRPAIFYPYHYGQVEEKTDIERLVRELEGVTEVRVRPME